MCFLKYSGWRRVMTEHRNEKGELHRVDGPAIEWADGTRAWWLDGKLHRVDGPAVERADGSCEYWLDGELFITSKYTTEKE